MQNWIEQALASSTADECVVIVVDHTGVDLRWALNSLISNGHTHSVRATVISMTGKQMSSVEEPITSADQLCALVAKADAASRVAEASPEALPLVDGGVDTDFAAAARTVDASIFDQFATDLGVEIAVATEHGHHLFGFAEYQLSTTWMGTSAGTRRRAETAWGRFEFSAKSPDLVNSSYTGQQTLDFSDVDVAAHHRELMQRLEWGKTRIDLPAGLYETILSPGAVVDLMLPLTWDLAHKSAVEGRSVFAGEELGSTKVGKKLATLPFSMWADPADATFPVPDFAVVHAAVPEETSVFDNGASVGRMDILADGCVSSLISPRTPDDSAPFVYPIDNMLIDARGDTDLDAMIAGTKRGLLVTCLWYIRTIDPQTLMLTGLTRDGVYLIEDGVVVGAVNNFRWNESPLAVLKKATEASRMEHCLCREWNDWFIRSKAPYVRIPDFNMSTVSLAY